MGLMEGIFWLTLNIYHEARSDPQLAQIAVAHVTINRTKNKKQTIKQVVLSPRQFSWTHLKQSWIPYDLPAFYQCLESALIAYRGFDFTQGATHYHHKDIEPYWTFKYHYVATFGSHKFYR